MFLPRLSKFTMESLLFVGLLLINHSCVLGNGSSIGVYNSRELSSSHYQNLSEEDTITNDVPNESIVTPHNRSSVLEGCQLPGRWQGKYFQHSTEVKIDGNSISGKGVCEESEGDKYLFVLPEEEEHCYKCVVILQKHINILQYKESDCGGKDTLENLCDAIPGDAQLHTLFRINSKPEECPFRGGPFKFSYNKGRGDCSWPESYIETCSESWKLSFHYQSCPSDTTSQSKVEELHCLAHWQEGSTNYLVGTLNGNFREKLEDRYRCFVFEEIKSTDGSATGRGSLARGYTDISGYKISQSGEASCLGMDSATSGEVNLELKKVFKEETSCTFPKWISSSEWNTLDGGKMIKVQEKDNSFVVSERVHANFSRTELIHPILVTGTRVQCLKREEITEDQLTIVARSTNGCKSDKICIHLYKRSELIIEMQIQTKSSTSEENFEEQCANGSLSHLAGNSSPLLTLVNSRAKTTECPFQGKFSVGGLTKYGEPIRNRCAEEGSREEFNSINIACKNPESFEMLSKCEANEEPQEFQCMEHWNESDKGFLIVSNTMMPMSLQNPSYCCSYKQSPFGYYVSVSGISCERNLFPSGDVLSTFNLTLEGSCQELHFVSSAAQLKHCDTLLSIVMVIIIFFGSFVTSK